jgi:hypothetical protein
MMGLTKPTKAEIEYWTSRGLTDIPEDLPFYEVCSTCEGTGIAAVG